MRATHEVVAALSFGLDARLQFSAILRVARMGPSGETSAIGKSGVMLSESRFSPQLVEMGLLPDDETGSAMRIQIRDPGGNLADGYEPSLTLTARSLTLSAADAISGNTVASAKVEQPM